MKTGRYDDFNLGRTYTRTVIEAIIYHIYQLGATDLWIFSEDSSILRSPYLPRREELSSAWIWEVYEWVPDYGSPHSQPHRYWNALDTESDKANWTKNLPQVFANVETATSFPTITSVHRKDRYSHNYSDGSEPAFL